MKVVVRHLSTLDYVDTFDRMRSFVDARLPTQADEIWYLEHHRVFTLGQGGRAVHVRDTGDIPLIRSDRGGQVTYHGPGQLVAYLLLDLRRLGIGPRELVRRIEQGILSLLTELGIDGERRARAPGVYTERGKIAALGLRIRRGTSYHGLALNVDLDLEPFARIDPCGFRDLAVTQLADFGIELTCNDVARRLTPHLVEALYIDADPVRVELVAKPERARPDPEVNARV